MTQIPAGTKFVGIGATVPTPENRSSQNNAFQEVYTIDDIRGYTETTVNISSAQILAMGTSPIELLPAPGVGKYYEVDKITFEYTHETTGYTIANRLYVYGGDIYVFVKNSLIADGSNYVGSVVPAPSLVDTVPVFQLENGLNSALTFSVEGGVDPTDGDGTMRAKISYKEITFGA